MRAAGCVVNYNNGISIEIGIVLANDVFLLNGYSGNLRIHYS